MDYLSYLLKYRVLDIDGANNRIDIEYSVRCCDGMYTKHVCFKSNPYLNEEINRDI